MFTPTLYIVGTPIGNLKDITERALETLRLVDVIASEDTRHTRNMLNYFEIRKTLISCFSYNEKKASERIVGLLKEGKNVAFVSDAGTPGVSDPGELLVRVVRAAGFKVVPIPGVSAFSTLLSVSGGGGRSVIFEGFLSIKNGKRHTRLLEIKESGCAAILYESPHRILKLLTEIDDIYSEVSIIIGREMTKIYEEFLFGTPKELKETLESRTELLGEFAIFIPAVKKERTRKEQKK